jgi:hypothetical protein
VSDPKSVPPDTVPEGEEPHTKPEVKSLVEKARADRDKRVPQGTMKTGADCAGGGGTKSLEPDKPAKPSR